MRFIVFALILVPFTIAGSAKEQWKAGHIIAMLVIGVCCIPAFVVWEMKAKHPLVPFRVSPHRTMFEKPDPHSPYVMKLLKDRGVWAAIFIAMFLNFAWYLQGE